MFGYPVWKWIIDLVWLSILCMVFHHFWRQRRLLVSAQSWLITKGQLIRCEWSEVGDSLWPSIEYKYQICGQECMGKYLFLDTIHNNPNSDYARHVAYKVAIAYKENREVDVFYNPNHPEQSALDITIPTKLNIILLGIIVMIMVHLVVIYSHLVF
ncbi:MAG: DUF3592 domain-containing protein [Legionella sp.]|nr:DUF3592 domain-containing protein [Legionella sp.]